MLSEKEKQEILKQLHAEIDEIRNRPVPETSIRLGEMHSIVCQLRSMGYSCETHGQEIIDVIENYDIDVSKLKFPQGSYDGFKKDVANGAYAFNDYDHSVMEITDEERDFINAEVAAGRRFQLS